jgi:hypothetical protein
LKLLKTYYKQLPAILKYGQTKQDSTSHQWSRYVQFLQKKRAKNIEINLNGAIITNKNTTKILRVIFDSRQTWTSYIKYLKKINNQFIKNNKNSIPNFMGRWIQVAWKIFNAIIQAKINYGAILYESTANSTLKLIDTVNNSRLRLALEAFQSSPTLSIYNLADEPPPTLKIINLFIKYIARLSRLNQGNNSDVNDEITTLTNENAVTPIKIIHRELNATPP